MSRRALRRLRGEQRGQEGPGLGQLGLDPGSECAREGGPPPAPGKGPRGPPRAGVSNRFELVREAKAGGRRGAAVGGRLLGGSWGGRDSGGQLLGGNCVGSRGRCWGTLTWGTAEVTVTGGGWSDSDLGQRLTGFAGDWREQGGSD